MTAVKHPNRPRQYHLRFQRQSLQIHLLQTRQERIIAQFVRIHYTQNSINVQILI